VGPSRRASAFRGGPQSDRVGEEVACGLSLRGRLPTIGCLLPTRTALHPHVQKLLELQKVDQEIASIRKDLTSLPAEEARRKKKLDELERARVARKEAADKAEVEARQLEVSIKAGDAEVTKLNERLNTVRNNAEYQATLFSIETVRKERDSQQEKCLVLLEQVEALRKQVGEAAELVAAERKIFDEFLAEAAKLRELRNRETAGVQAKRDQMAQGVPPEVLGRYQRLFDSRNGVAVAPVEGGYCQGCYNKVTTNDVARLMGGSSVVECDACQRILYLGS